MLDPDFLKRAMPAATLATEAAILVVGGLGLGYWLDGRLGTSPWLTLLLTGGGFAAGLLALVRGLNRLQRTDDRDSPPPP